MPEYQNGLDIGRWNTSMSTKNGLGNFVPGGKKLKAKLSFLSQYNSSIASNMESCFTSGIERIEKCRGAIDKTTQQKDRHTRNHLKIVVRGFLYLVAILKKGSRVTENGEWKEINRSDFANLITPGNCVIEGHKLYVREELQKFASLTRWPVAAIEKYYEYKKSNSNGKQVLPLKEELFLDWYADTYPSSVVAKFQLSRNIRESTRCDEEEAKAAEAKEKLEKTIKRKKSLEVRVSENESRLIQLEQFQNKLLKTVNVLAKI
tara:strand:- start:38 stop:823 length:786 start_codon:yes stop_codon:yes gene_type:complete